MRFSTVAVRRASDPSRWVRVTMNLRGAAGGASFVEYPPRFRCQITPADPEAVGCQDANWLSGVVSGLGYAWRRWLRPDRGVLVSEVRGRLGRGDIEGIAVAASIAVRELLGEEVAPTGGDWQPDESLAVTPWPDSGAAAGAAAP